MKGILLSLIIVMSLFGQEFVELKLPNSNKIVLNVFKIIKYKLYIKIY